jgi:PAS domain S-box-containing protein
VCSIFSGFSTGRDAMTVHLAADISYRLALLDAVTDGAHEGIIALDLTGTIIGWNRAAQRIYQYSAEEVVGQHTAILVPPDRLAELEQKLQRIRNGEGIEQYETVRRRKDGQPIHVALVSIPLRDSTGQLLGAAALVRDITARRRDEEVLRQSQTRLRLLVEQMPAVVWTVDEQLRFTSSLGAGLAGLNLRPNETVGRTLAEFFQADDPEFLPIAMHRRALAGDGSTRNWSSAFRSVRRSWRPSMMNSRRSAIPCRMTCVRRCVPSTASARRWPRSAAASSTRAATTILNACGPPASGWQS